MEGTCEVSDDFSEIVFLLFEEVVVDDVFGLLQFAFPHSRVELAKDNFLIIVKVLLNALDIRAEVRGGAVREVTLVLDGVSVEVAFNFFHPELDCLLFDHGQKFTIRFG